MQGVNAQQFVSMLTPSFIIVYVWYLQNYLCIERKGQTSKFYWIVQIKEDTRKWRARWNMKYMPPTRFGS
jgi:hypothetical protein